MMKQPTKAIICAAGFGTRFLPQTKAMPKEMLPIEGKPAIQLIVEHAVAAGVTDIIIVTGATKRAVEDHFDRSYELERELRDSGKSEKADEIEKIANLANFIYVRQKDLPRGTGRAILTVKHLIKDDEPFYVFFPDDFFRSAIPWPIQLKDAYNLTGKSVVAITKVDINESKKYGMVELGKKESDTVSEVVNIVEKPAPDYSPSDFALCGSCLLMPSIIPLLEEQVVGSGGEIVLTDSISRLAKQDAVYASVIEGTWHDTGDQLGYIKAVVDYGLENEEYGKVFEEHLRKRLS